MSRHVLVTGGAGFIGSHLCRLLIHKGYHVITLDALTYAGNLENIADLRAHTQFTFKEGSINDGVLVQQLLERYQIEAVLHLAAESHVDNSIASPAEFIRTNIEGTYTLLETCRNYWQQLEAQKQSEFRFIHVSTDEVYGSLELESNERFNETTPYQPHSPYSASKAASDHLAHAWFCTYGLPTIITHCSNNFGPNQYPEKLIPFFVQSALEGKPLPVYGDGKNVRDWIYVEDHCHGLYLALTQGKAGETYCFGGDKEISNIELVNQLCQTLDQLAPRKDQQSYAQQITFVEDRLGHDRRYAIDNKKANQALGFSRQSTFEEAFAKTIAWYSDAYQASLESKENSAHA